MKLKTILPLMGILVAAILIFFFLTKGNSDEEKTLTAQCLSAQGFAMAGTSWCSHCKEQKELFGSAFQYVTYHDCDLEEDWCNDHDIQLYPSWVSPTGAVSPGVKSLATLKKMSGCE